MDAVCDTPIWSTPTLTGRHVRLEPLRVDHADALCAAASDGALWELRYTSVPGPEAGEAERYIEIALAARDAGQVLPFVVLDVLRLVVVGTTRFYSTSIAACRGSSSATRGMRSACSAPD